MHVSFLFPGRNSDILNFGDFEILRLNTFKFLSENNNDT